MSAIGSWSSAHFSSCRQAMSGFSWLSHSSSRGIRARMPLMLNVASFMGQRLAARSQLVIPSSGPRRLLKAAVPYSPLPGREGLGVGAAEALGGPIHDSLEDSIRAVIERVVPD